MNGGGSPAKASSAHSLETGLQAFPGRWDLGGEGTLGTAEDQGRVFQIFVFNNTKGVLVKLSALDHKKKLSLTMYYLIWGM